MTLLERAKHKSKPVLDLAGPDGNAYALLSYAIAWSKQLNMDRDAIVEEMKAGDYKHLVKTLDKHFGHVVDLLMPDDGI